MSQSTSRGGGPPRKFPGSHRPFTAGGLSRSDDSKKLFDDRSQPYVKNELTQLLGVLGLRIDNYSKLLASSGYEKELSEDVRSTLEDECAGDVAADADRVGEMIDSIQQPDEDTQTREEGVPSGGTDAVKIMRAIEAWEAAEGEQERFRTHMKKKTFAEMLRAKVEESLSNLCAGTPSIIAHLENSTATRSLDGPTKFEVRNKGHMTKVYSQCGILERWRSYWPSTNEERRLEELHSRPGSVHLSSATRLMQLYATEEEEEEDVLLASQIFDLVKFSTMDLSFLLLY